MTGVSPFLIVLAIWLVYIELWESDTTISSCITFLEPPHPQRLDLIIYLNHFPNSARHSLPMTVRCCSVGWLSMTSSSRTSGLPMSCRLLIFPKRMVHGTVTICRWQCITSEYDIPHPNQLHWYCGVSSSETRQCQIGSEQIPPPWAQFPIFLTSAGSKFLTEIYHGRTPITVKRIDLLWVLPLSRGVLSK